MSVGIVVWLRGVVAYFAQVKLEYVFAIALLLPLAAFGQLNADAPAAEPRTAPDKALAEFRREAIKTLLLDPRGPIDSASVFGLRYFAYNDTFDLAAVFRPSEDTALFRFPTSDGSAREYRSFGTLTFQVADSMYVLTVFEVPGMARHPLYFDHLFLPFFDETNGDATYGGGRYLDLKRSDFAAGDYCLDFNKAYNPWCAYATGYSCPVPPLSNLLPLAVRAGEAAFVRVGEVD